MRNLLIMVFALTSTVGMSQIGYDDYPLYDNVGQLGLVQIVPLLPMDYGYVTPVRVIIIDYYPVVDPYYTNFPNQWNYNTLATPMPVNPYWTPVNPYWTPRTPNKRR